MNLKPGGRETLTARGHTSIPSPSRLPLFGTEYRSDIQGMRAVAVLLVLLFHAGIPGFSGGFVGVDVFFVLSGYLITSIVAREIHERGTLSISRFYGQRILRIIPAATIVLIAVSVATVLWLPITRWRSTAFEVIGSSLYFSNWQFATSTNYLNAAEPPSALQHFWSLAVEEQYYLLWPAALVLGFLLIRNRMNLGAQTLRRLRFAFGLMIAITAVSFGISVMMMRSNPDAAYFVTPTRLWELGVGSLLALAVPRLRSLSLSASRLLAIGGLIAVLVAGVFYSDEFPFPGVTALLPVLGTAAMVAGGVGTASSQRRHRVLGNPVMVWVGDISYALYLWHWPILIIGQQGFGLTGGLASVLLVGSSIIPAYLSTHFIEKPIARNLELRASPKRAYRVGVMAVLCSLLAAGAVLGLLKWNTQPAADFDVDTAGAATLQGGTPLPELTQVPRDLTPSLVNAKNDVPAVYANGCHLEVSQTALNECEFGKTNGPTAVLIGDSHAAQWFSALERYAKENGIRLVAMTKSSCPFADLTVELTGKQRPYNECTTWNSELRDYIEREQPIAIFTSTLGVYVDAENPQSTSALEEGLHRSWEWATSLGIPVYALADSPYMSSNVPECLAQHTSGPTACAVSHDDAYPYAGLEARAASGLMDVKVVDVNDRICPGSQCQPIIGSVLVYRDQHHLSDTYVRTLYPALLERIGQLAGAPGSS